MTLHSINGNQSQTQHITSTGDTWRVESNAVLTGSSAIEIDGGAAENRIFIDGTIDTPNYGIYEFGGADNDFVVGKSGHVSAFISAYISGDDSDLTNYGTMGSSQANSSGAYFVSGSHVFRNFGTIAMTAAANTAGVLVIDTDDTEIENHGNIMSEVVGINIRIGNANIVNAKGASISGDAFGVRLGSDQQTGEVSLTNAGQISSSDTAIEGSIGGDRISNSGTIGGTITLGGGNDDFVNKGVVNGDIFLGAGNDHFSNKGGNWTAVGMLDSGEGRDTIDLRRGLARDNQGVTPQIWGGDGNDTYIVDKTTFDLRENSGGGTDTVKIDKSFALATNFENLTLIGRKDIDGNGNAADNVVNGNAGDNILNGMGGEDLIDGGAGVDTLVFDPNGAKGVSASLLLGKAKGADNLYSFISNVENLRGTQFVDVLNGNGKANVIEGGAGGDLLNGNGGKDTLSYRHSSVGVSVDLKLHTESGGDADGDILLNFENMSGSFHDDTLGGDDTGNRLTGGQGDDILTGHGGADIFVFSGHFGKDEVSDFSAKDDKDFSGGRPLFKDFDAMMTHVSVAGADLVIHHGKDTLTLDNTDLSDLHVSHFVF